MRGGCWLTSLRWALQLAAILFIFGFGASAVFGTYAGEMADKYGRRLSCYVYCISYIVSCLTKHSPNFYVLLFGRVTGGVATSILFSSFESWLVAEHNKNFYPAEWLNQTLSLATLLNGITAIAAGSLGALVRNRFDSLVAPFDLAIVFLIVAMLVITSMWVYQYHQRVAGVWLGNVSMCLRWAENKGEVSLSSGGGLSGRSKFSEALEVLRGDQKIVLLGSIQSCFEAAMYIFVFMWTPKLEPLFTPLPHGQVFGCFMACTMMGSSLVNYLIKLKGSPVGYLRELLLVSAVCLSLPALVTSSGVLALVCFFVFEAACGIYWPSMGIIKSKYVPEEVRATMYNVFRVPLNLIVVIVLANLGTISDNSVLCICGFLLGAAALMHHLFESMVKESLSAEPSAPPRASQAAEPHADGTPLAKLADSAPSEIQPA
jgi:hypothetical protein